MTNNNTINICYYLLGQESQVHSRYFMRTPHVISLTPGGGRELLAPFPRYLQEYGSLSKDTWMANGRPRM